jgi:hypothetical protein
MARRMLPGDAAKVNKNLGKDKQNKEAYRFRDANAMTSTDR